MRLYIVIKRRAKRNEIKRVSLLSFSKTILLWTRYCRQIPFMNVSQSASPVKTRNNPMIPRMTRERVEIWHFSFATISTRERSLRDVSLPSPKFIAFVYRLSGAARNASIARYH